MKLSRISILWIQLLPYDSLILTAVKRIWCIPVQTFANIKNTHIVPQQICAERKFKVHFAYWLHLMMINIQRILGRLAFILRNEYTSCLLDERHFWIIEDSLLEQRVSKYLQKFI